MYEPRSRPLLPWRQFLRRLGQHGAIALALIAGSLAVGTWGYHVLGEQGWLDAFLNAAMLLGGMGQVANVTTTAGRLFAAFFALYSGLLLIAVTTIMLAPVLHRILHRLHAEEPEAEESPEG
ncbi:MAG TPA: hypothetical protein VGP87_10085 [Gemmatimonadales bacterium]|jgi:ABC-type Co2+ transport system permease subunit|nr:hypothetical protein [Gemmatimonadales bacterium]